MSTNMVTNYLKECGIKVMLIPALDYMRTDANSEPDMSFIKENLSHILERILATTSTSHKDLSAAISMAK